MSSKLYQEWNYGDHHCLFINAFHSIEFKQIFPFNSVKRQIDYFTYLVDGLTTCLLPFHSYIFFIIGSDEQSNDTHGLFDIIRGFKRLDISLKNTSKTQPLSIYFNR